MTHTIKAADTAQLLSLIPHLLGCVPTSSLVLVLFSKGCSLGAMRMDLPVESDTDACERVAATALEMMSRSRTADAFVCATFSNGAGTEPDYVDLTRALLRRAEEAGTTVIDALSVMAHGWASHITTPRDGLRALTEIDHPDAGALPPLARGDQASGAALPAASQAAKTAAAEAGRSLQAALNALCAPPNHPVRGTFGRVDPAALEVACLVDDLPALYESALAWKPSEVSPLRAALLTWCLARPSFRDVALVQWAGDADHGLAAMEAQRRWEDGEEYPTELACVIWGDGPRPDPERLAAALRLTRQVASVAPRSQRPGILACCAWIAWALGHSTHASRYAEMATDIDHEHGLATIVLDFSLYGHVPEWVFGPVS